jgi:hypothetical protein
MSTKFIYSDRIGPSLPGGGNLYFRTVTSYTQDSSGRVTNPATRVYYSGLPGGKSNDGALWTDGSSTSLDGFNAGGFVPAASTLDGGKTFTPFNYEQIDLDAGRIPSGKKVGDPILGPTAILSLSTPGGVLNTAIQNSIINTAVKTEPGLAKQLAAKLQNTASPDPSLDSVPATPGFKTEELDKGINPINKDGKTAIKQHGDYSYPSEMPNDMDRIKFNMYTYGIRKTNPNFTGLNEKRERGELKGSVTLGIQPRISDTNSVSWNDLSANAIELTAAGASIDLISRGAEGISDVLKKLGNTVGAEKSNIQEYAKTWFAGQAAGINGLTSRIGGVILNPNLELLFDGPQLRPFDFTFQLTPRDAPEAKQVKQIIRFFKQGMAVQRTETELFLKAPNIFEIAYLYQTEDRKTGAITTKLHPGLNQIKRCALQSCSVDYTPTGSYMTFPDGTMTAYNITLSFKELEPVYSDEYQDPDDNETVDSVRIGF